MVERGFLIAEVDLQRGPSLLFEVFPALRGGFVGQQRSELLVDGLFAHCFLHVDLVGRLNPHVLGVVDGYEDLLFGGLGRLRFGVQPLVFLFLEGSVGVLGLRRVLRDSWLGLGGNSGESRHGHCCFLGLLGDWWQVLS